MNSTEFYQSCDDAVRDFNPILNRLFPDMVTSRVVYNNALQSKSSLSVAIISPWEVTRHNADINFTPMMHLTNNWGKVEDIEKFSLENMGIPKKFKYRKISGKSPYIVIEKFVKWLEKNRDAILNEVK